SRCRSGSAGTRRRRSCARSSSARRPARPCSTSSPTACRWTSSRGSQGARLVAISETLAPELAARAAEHDRAGTYPFEAIDALKAAGYFAAPVPVELGGLGVCCAHDLVVGSSRLARGDASVAIGVSMHLLAVLN